MIINIRASAIVRGSALGNKKPGLARSLYRLSQMSAQSGWLARNVDFVCYPTRRKRNKLAPFISLARRLCLCLVLADWCAPSAWRQRAAKCTKLSCSPARALGERQAGAGQTRGYNLAPSGR